MSFVYKYGFMYRTRTTVPYWLTSLLAWPTNASKNWTKSLLNGIERNPPKEKNVPRIVIRGTEPALLRKNERDPYRPGSLAMRKNGWTNWSYSKSTKRNTAIAGWKQPSAKELITIRWQRYVCLRDRYLVNTKFCIWVLLLFLLFFVFHLNQLYYDSGATTSGNNTNSNRTTRNLPWRMKGSSILKRWNLNGSWPRASRVASIIANLLLR